MYETGDLTSRSRRRVFQGFRVSSLFKRKAKSSGCGENEVRYLLTYSYSFGLAINSSTCTDCCVQQLREYNTCSSGSGGILPEVSI